MNNKIYLPNGMEAYQAVYNQFPIEEYNNNPFIQALPLLTDKKSIIKNLMINPNFNVEEKELDSSYRLHIIQRLYKFFQPLPIHVKIWNMISTLIRQGYLARNPFDREYRKYINYTGKQIINRTFEINGSSNFRTTASCGIIIGISGMGKTTTVNGVLSNIPQIIVHNEYNGQNFSQIQLTWLKLEAPHNSSLKALSLQFFMKIDELLGKDNFKKYVSRNLSTDAMLPLMGRVAQNIGLGILIIDEIQHLKGKGVTQMMNYFVTLINSFGVPIVFIGTPASYDIFKNEFRIARRVTGNGEVIWNNMRNDGEFRLFLEGLWKYQWTKKYTPLTEDIINIVYQETQGISDLIVKLFINSQCNAILNGKEEITLQIIKKVVKDQFKLMKPMLEAIKSGNPYKIMQYEDIMRIDSDSFEKKANVSTSYSNKDRLDVNKSKIKKEILSKVNEKKAKIKNEYKDNDIRTLLDLSKNKDLSIHDILVEHNYIDDMRMWMEDDI